MLCRLPIAHLSVSGALAWSVTEPTVAEMRERYLQLLKTDLPAAAKSSSEPWPIRLDHCFMRVVLDNLFGRCWYEALDRRKPAYVQLTSDQLGAAIALARSMLDGGPTRVRMLNDQSLRFRKKGRGASKVS